MIKGINTPNRTLYENLVLIQGDQLTKCFRRQPGRQQGIRRAVAEERAVRYQLFVNTFGPYLLSGLAECQCLRLGEHISQQLAMMFSVAVATMRRLRKTYKIARHQLGALMQQLVKGMLAIGAGLTPYNRASLIIHRCAVFGDPLAIALHIALLEVGREPAEVLIIRQDSFGLRMPKVVIPGTNKPENNRRVLGQRGSAEVLIHSVKAIKHLAEVFSADRHHYRQTDSAAQ